MKHFLSLFILMLVPLAVNADAVEIDGICYNLIEKGKVAEVTRNFNRNYSGNVIIPEKVSYGGIDYDVTSIAGNVSHNGNTYLGGAFRGCTGLTSVTIPNSVTSIGYGAFYQCSGLTSVNIPEDVTSIGEDAFSGCSGLTSLTIPNSASIGKNAFAGCSGLTSITIPSSWSSIGYGVFAGCTGLTSVTIPDNIYSIDDTAFSGCTGLTSVTIPNSVNGIGKQAFYGCTSLSSITIPSSVYYIGNGAFLFCNSLTSITIPESVTSIGSGTFAYCKNLASVNIPQSVTSIGGDDRYGGAFGGCSALTSIIIPNSVTSIGNQAFLGCDNLKTVKIGSGIRSIGSYAFMNCPKLADVYCYSENVPSTNSDVFSNSYIEYATLHVPQSSVNLYQKRTPWSSFKSIVTIEGNIPETQKCATPTISYVNGKLIFTCDTEGAECVATITDADIKTHYGNEIPLTMTYTVSVYATKEGYENSDVVTKIIDLTGTAGSGVYGDVNGDGVVDAADVVKVTNIIMGNN